MWMCVAQRSRAAVCWSRRRAWAARVAAYFQRPLSCRTFTASIGKPAEPNRLMPGCKLRISLLGLTSESLSPGFIQVFHLLRLMGKF